MVRKSPKRTLICTVRPATPWARRRVATASARPTSSRSRVERRWWSRAKVSSWPIDFAFRSGSHDPRVVPVGERVQVAALAAPEGGDQVALAAGRRGRRPWRRPRRSSLASVAGPTPHSACTGSGCRKARVSAGSTTATPEPDGARWATALGLAASEASLATNLVPATPTEQVRPSSASTRSRMWAAICGAGPSRRTRAGDVEERLVERERLDQRGDVAEDRHDPGAHLGVAAVAPGEEDRLGAQPAGLHRRHGRVHAEGPGLVGRGGHHAPVAGAADDDRAGRAARGGRAARPTRRTRPCRRAGSSPSSGPRAARRPGRWRSHPGDDERRPVGAGDAVPEAAPAGPRLGQPLADRLGAPRASRRSRWVAQSPLGTQRASSTMPSGSAITISPSHSAACQASTRRVQPMSGAWASIS